MNKILSLFHKSKLDRQMEEEFEFHLDQLAAGLEAKGMTRTEALREARRQFGNRAAHREAYQDQRGFPWLADALADFRYGLRLLARTPGFTAIALLTIALGVGANTAIFSLVNRALFTLAPYPDAHRLVDITRVQKGQIGWPVFASDQYLYYRTNAKSFENVAASRGVSGLNLLHNGQVTEVSAQLASDNHFRTLGVEPFLGRSFTPAEDQPGGPDVVILSHTLWQSRFGGARSILDQPINLGGKMFTVVGIMPAHYNNVLERDLWFPLRARPIYDGENTHVFGRLKNGVTVEQANAEIVQLTSAFASQQKRFGEKAALESATLAPLWSHMGRGYRPILSTLLAATGVILLIGSVNLANLLLARGAGRIREIAVRATLGAGRWRIVRQMLVESLVIAAIGGVLGIGLAHLFLPALLALNPVDQEAFAGASINASVLLFSIAISLATGLFFGLVPAIQAARLELSDAARESGPKASAGRRTTWFRQSLVVAEIALSFALLIGATMILRGFYQMLTTPTGADTTRVLLANMTLQGERFSTNAKVNALFNKGLERLRAHPEIELAAISLNVPLERGMNWGARVPGFSPNTVFTEWRYNSPGYFAALRIPMLAGRDFNDTDTMAAAPVVVVSKRFADRYFPNQAVIGQQIFVSPEKTTRTVIGVAGDVRQRDIAGQFSPTAYLPAAQVSNEAFVTAHGWFKPVWIVRARTADQARTMRIVEEEIRAVDPLQPISSFHTFDDLRKMALTVPRFVAVLIGAFAVLALILAAAGIYGVISYQVAQRTQEFGIRLALGASAVRVAASILQSTAVLAAIGLALGAWAGLSVAKLMRSVARAVPEPDATTFLLAALFLLAIALLSSAIPAWRVSRLDPALALRVDH